MARKDRLDVLHLIGTLSPGGAERNLYYLAPHLQKSRLRYGICCLARRGQFADVVERLGLPVFELGYRKRHFFRTVLRLTRLLKEKRVNVLHTHLFECGLVGRLAAWLAGVPVIIVHEHGKTLWKKWYHRLFERVAIHGTDLRIAVSKDIMGLRLELEKTPPSKIRVVFNVVDPVMFEVDDRTRRDKRKELGLDGRFVIGTVGRLIDAKAYDLLLEVARQVCAVKPDVRFVLVGDGPSAAQLQDLRQQLGLAEKVLMLGQRGDIPELMAAMDLYIITSKREGLPVTLIEAMMAGKTIVSTAVGGIPDALSHNENGIIVEPGSKEALVKAVLKIMDDPETMQRLGTRAKATALMRYAPEQVLSQLETIYEELLLSKGVEIG
jgi:glycosyltransferase involved in cell wall biosynthesis